MKLQITNLETGKAPTLYELKQIKDRAVEIFRNPCASPEQMDWAISAYPEGMAETFELNPYQQKRQEWRHS